MAQLEKSKSPTMKKLIQKHPLQRLQSPSRGLSATLHVIGLLSFGESFRYLSANPNHINSAYGWHFQYLTIIGLLFSTLTFLSGLISDLTLSPSFFLAKNILAILSAPLALLITTLYWGLRAIDPALVVPPDLELPFSVDLGFHLVPTVLLLVDLFLFSPPWTITVVPALGLSTVIALAYWYWIEVCYRHNGFYPYPLFEILGMGQRAALFGGSAVVMAGVTVVLRWVYGLVNGVERVRRGERPGNVKGL